MAITNPTIRQKRLGAELRKLREAAGMSGEEAAAVLECRQTKISRIENGLNNVRPFELRGLLNAYGVTDTALTEALVEMAKDGSRRGWWNPYGKVLPGLADLAHLESKAVSIHVWQTHLVPGLLQTPDYMRALFMRDRFAADVEKSVEARLARQQVLEKGDGPKYWAVLYESALLAQVGEPHVRRAQWGHLINLVESDRITLQILPFSAGVHGGLDGPFLIFGMPLAGMDVVMADNIASPVFLENDDDIESFRTLFDSLRAAAFGPLPSLDLLRRAERNLL